jgi:phosphomevalonate kinase
MASATSNACTTSNTSTSTSTSTTASAPGKILLAGGYLVLESPNVGLVVAVDKRFYSTVEFTGGTSGEATETASSDRNSDSDDNMLSITVKSPQFRQEWRYLYQKSLCSLTADESFNTSTNDFVEKTLRVSLLYLLTVTLSDVDVDVNVDVDTTDSVPRFMFIQRASALLITIRADNDFYSLVPHLEERHLDRSLESVQKLPSFLPATADADGKILKTGLGSSAALVTSLVAALYHACLDSTCVTGKSGDDDDHPDTDTDTDSRQTQTNTVIHNLAQICHCHAQGKVGSGFDVSSACHGSHVYQRFPASILANLLTRLDDNTNNTNNNNNLSTVGDLLRETVESRTWTGGVAEPLQLPDVLQVMLADVSGGSESPSMARTVLAWKNNKEQQAAVPHWDDLEGINRSIINLLKRVRDVSISEQEKQALAGSTADCWEAGSNSNANSVGHLLFQLRQAFQESRRHLKAMGDAASVPIEPDEQSSLADATLALPGVIAALVPGAGGYDALACVYINDDAVRQGIGKLWAGWQPTKVCPLTIQGANYGQGIRIEP